MSAPNNKSMKRKEPTLFFVEIWFGLVLNFIGSICLLGLAFSLNDTGTKIHS